MKIFQIAILSAGLIFAGTSMAAATAVTGADGAQAAAKQVTYTVSDPAKYVASTFNFNVSAYVAMSVEESAHGIAVGAASFRGLPNVFTGSSEGGEVSVCGTPAGSGASISAVATVTGKVDVTKVGGCTSNAAVNAAAAAPSNPS